MDYPHALEPPFDFGNEPDLRPFWRGEAKMRIEAQEFIGESVIVLDKFPTPRIRFTFRPLEGVPHVRQSRWPEIVLGPARIECGFPIGELNCKILKCTNQLSGIVASPETIVLPTSRIRKAKFIVFNGPHVLGSQIVDSEGVSFCGRLESDLDCHSITIDAVTTNRPNTEKVHEVTHVIQCMFRNEMCSIDLVRIRQHIFRVVSLMRCRWVGILGPWCFDHLDQLVGVNLTVTKNRHINEKHSWFDATMASSFPKLYRTMYEAFQDIERRESLETALHWLVETEQCAGGVEGALILQQSALECLAWLEVVVRRKFCSSSGFEKLPAADKIRWLLSINNINASIPAHATGIKSYAGENNLNSLVEVLVDVRNALVHAMPKKVERLFGRKSGGLERTQLWYQVGGLLQLAFLASVGYDGLAMQRHFNCELVTDAIVPVPWSK